MKRSDPEALALLRDSIAQAVDILAAANDTAAVFAAPVEAAGTTHNAPTCVVPAKVPNPNAGINRLAALVARDATDQWSMREQDRVLREAQHAMSPAGWLHDAAFSLDEYERDELLAAVALCLGRSL